MRKRFRGNRPVGMSQLGDGSEMQGGQLYAGRPAVGAVVGTTDGKEEERKEREREREREREEG